MVASRENVEPVVRMRGVTKGFPGVLAVDGVDLEIMPGEVHVVAGENGAGKSTLMKLLSQVEKPTRGVVEISGEPVEFRGPGHAQSLGVAMVHQEFALAPHLSVAENLFMGREPGRLGFVDRKGEIEAARGLLERVGLRVAPRRLVASLTVAERQRVEIAKALAVDAKVVILDEPTATLAEKEIEELFGVIRGLTAQGIAILYISHRLDEIFRISDRVTVMRDGRVVATVPTNDLDEEKLVRLMVGREVGNLYPKPEIEAGDVRLRVSGLNRAGVLEDCSFEVRRGEILGFAGLVGAGRTELARAVFGADPVDSGTVELDGREIHATSPRQAIEAGIGYLTEDRKGEGLAMDLGIDQNVTLANLPMRLGMLNLGAEGRTAKRRRDELNIRTPSLRRQVRMLSGGNQQKVVVAKWLETRARRPKHAQLSRRPYPRYALGLASAREAITIGQDTFLQASPDYPSPDFWFFDLVTELGILAELGIDLVERRSSVSEQAPRTVRHPEQYDYRVFIRCARFFEAYVFDGERHLEFTRIRDVTNQMLPKVEQNPTLVFIHFYASS